MDEYLKSEILEDYLAHHGILGQRWGVRRFQNKDGTLTAAGRKRKKSADMDFVSVYNKPRQRKYDKTDDPYDDTFKVPKGAIIDGPSNYLKIPKNAKVDGPTDSIRIPKGAMTMVGKSSSQKSSMSEDTKRKIFTGAFMTVGIAAATAYAMKHPEKIESVISKAKNVDVKSISKKTIDKGKNYVAKATKDAIQSAKEGIKEGIKEGPKKAAKAIVVGTFMNQAKRGLDKAVGKEESARIFQANDNKKIGKFWKVIKEDEDD